MEGLFLDKPGDISLLDPGLQWLVRSLSFEQYRHWQGWIDALRRSGDGPPPNYGGASSLFHDWGDDVETHDRKVQILSEAISNHHLLAGDSVDDIPFRFVTEPFGEKSFRHRDRVFGEWDWSERHIREIVSFLAQGQIDFVSISQNRINHGSVRAKTIKLAENMNACGAEVAIGWQMWGGVCSAEGMSAAEGLAMVSRSLALGFHLGEVGFRYSGEASPGKANWRAVRARELEVVRERMFPVWREALKGTGVAFSWWNGQDGDDRPNACMCLPELTPGHELFQLGPRTRAGEGRGQGTIALEVDPGSVAGDTDRSDALG